KIGGDGGANEVYLAGIKAGLIIFQSAIRAVAKMQLRRRPRSLHDRFIRRIHAEPSQSAGNPPPGLARRQPEALGSRETAEMRVGIQHGHETDLLPRRNQLLRHFQSDQAAERKSY